MHTAYNEEGRGAGETLGLSEKWELRRDGVKKQTLVGMWET